MTLFFLFDFRLQHYDVSCLDFDASPISNRHHFPMLIAQWQEAVTRRDMAELFSFEDFKEVCEKKIVTPEILCLILF